MKLISLIILLVTLVLVIATAYDTFNKLDIIQSQSAPYRSTEGVDLSQKDYMCIDTKANPGLANTLFGKTGCYSLGELQAKKVAQDAVLQRSIFILLVIFGIGAMGLFASNKKLISDKVK